MRMQTKVVAVASGGSLLAIRRFHDFRVTPLVGRCDGNLVSSMIRMATEVEDAWKNPWAITW